jgi:glycosyltransferase involved in cell wall biosynthesis
MNELTDYPLFTVIIPQKDRAEYLIHTLKTCMIQDYPNFEIIVSDDCSEDNSVEVVRELMKKDSRIKLFAHDHNLGMRDNFEFALNQVRPGYVIALGGDDGLLPGCIQKMHYLLTSTNTELLTWPSSKFIFPGLYSDSGRLMLSKREGVNIIKSKDFLKKMSINFNYNSDDECPMFYIKGVASTKLVQNVKMRSLEHRFYSCPTPDGFSGIVLAGEVENYCYTAEPLSILGSTTSSQGLNYLRNNKKSIEESNNFFKQNETKPMHEELASQQYSPLISLMTADYLLTSRDLPGWAGEFPPIDFKNLLKKCFNELSDAFYSTERMNRELQILKEIAIKHSLINYYNYLLKTTRKKKYHIRNITGSGFGPRSVYFDSSTLKINNIYEAAYATVFLYNLVKSISLKNSYKIIHKTIKYYLKIRILGERISSINGINKNI